MLQSSFLQGFWQHKNKIGIASAQSRELYVILLQAEYLTLSVFCLSAFNRKAATARL